MRERIQYETDSDTRLKVPQSGFPEGRTVGRSRRRPSRRVWVTGMVSGLLVIATFSQTTGWLYSEIPVNGVFRGTAPDKVEAFEEWAGHPVGVAGDFSARESWADISSPGYLLDAWRNSDHRLTLGVAMLPADGSATLRAGAEGDYDQHFEMLARNLVEAGQEDAILRVGWEFNLSESPWFAENPREFVAYWREIITTMRSVEGQQFAFDWNPNNGPNPMDAVTAYPGDDVVDYIGVDVYDVSGRKDTYPYPDGCNETCRQERQSRAWLSQIYGGERGLAFWRDYAHEHDKPLSLPEWGGWDRVDGTGGGDNPSFIRRMHEFITDERNGVGYHVYFEVDTAHGRHSLIESLPAAGREYRRLFGD